MGRPSQNLTTRITVRMTPEEMESLKADADAAAADVAALARARILGAEPPRRVRRKSADHTALANVLRQLGKIGGNLNQLAHNANAYGDLPAVRELEKLMMELREIRQTVHDALAP